MEKNLLAETVKKIELSEDRKERIIKNCYEKMEESVVSKNVQVKNATKRETTRNCFKRPMVAVASLAICLCLTGVTALASTGKLQGFFKDIVRWDGAVTGTTYEQATEEVELYASVVSDVLAVEMIMINPNTVPYSTLETLGIGQYKIVDGNGNTIVEKGVTENAEVTDGKANVAISLSEMASGKYKLMVNTLVGGAKAEQPLAISGNWECEFVK